MTLANPAGMIHVEMWRGLSRVRWADDEYDDPKIPYKLGHDWPRCFACELTDDRGIIPAFAVTRDGVPVCLAHLGLGGMPWVSLRPPCAVCGVECRADEIEDEDGNYQYGHAYSVGGAPVVGYLCPAHADRGIATPGSVPTWVWNPVVPS